MSRYLITLCIVVLFFIQIVSCVGPIEEKINERERNNREHFDLIAPKLDGRITRRHRSIESDMDNNNMGISHEDKLIEKDFQRIRTKEAAELKNAVTHEQRELAIRDESPARQTLSKQIFEIQDHIKSQQDAKKVVENRISQIEKIVSKQDPTALIPSGTGTVSFEKVKMNRVDKMFQGNDAKLARIKANWPGYEQALAEQTLDIAALKTLRNVHEQQGKVLVTNLYNGGRTLCADSRTNGVLNRVYESNPSVYGPIAEADARAIQNRENNRMNSKKASLNGVRNSIQTQIDTYNGQITGINTQKDILLRQEQTSAKVKKTPNSPLDEAELDDALLDTPLTKHHNEYSPKQRFHNRAQAKVQVNVHVQA